MLFHSYIFIAVFLPLVLLSYRLCLLRWGRASALGCLALASLIFYAAWRPEYLLLLLGSIVFNYAVSRRIGPGYARSKIWMIGGITGNLLLLGVFKYAAFTVRSVNYLAETGYTIPDIALPLAISFFTFQQITYLVDCHRGLVEEHGPGHYLVFVTFFPQLIAGPIVHHGEMMSQFVEPKAPDTAGLSRGFTWFVIGLFKKVVIADTIGKFVSPVFGAGAKGELATLFEAWGAVIGYTVQIYFDFSGYCDMAIGVALMLGIQLPLNFNSPYKSTSVKEYWRRWHMTLGRFLKEYLYIPLGGSRRGRARQYANLMMVLLLAGLWHGAGWNFIVWGGIHGVFLVLNHAFGTWLVPRMRWLSRVPLVCYGALTLGCIAVARVFFRSDSMPAAGNLLRSLAGLNGVSVSDNLQPLLGSLARFGLQFNDTGRFESEALPWVIVGLLVCVILPNTQEIMGRVATAGRIKIRWKPDWKWSLFTAALFVISLLHFGELTEFIYYRF